MKLTPLKITESGKKRFGQALKNFRESRGMSLRDAEQYIYGKCGSPVSFNTISNIERGYRNVDTETLLLFAQSGYGGMKTSEMLDMLTGGRLSDVESDECHQMQAIPA